MPIGPEEVERILTANDRSAVEKLVAEIDERLPRAYRDEPVTWVAVSGYPNPRVEREITRLYREAGWAKVEFREDQRDGASIGFVKPVPPPEGPPT